MIVDWGNALHGRGGFFIEPAFAGQAGADAFGIADYDDLRRWEGRV
jgi:hypothetical protein